MSCPEPRKHLPTGDSATRFWKAMKAGGYLPPNHKEMVGIDLDVCEEIAVIRLLMDWTAMMFDESGGSQNVELDVLEAATTAVRRWNGTGRKTTADLGHGNVYGDHYDHTVAHIAAGGDHEGVIG